ncbi:hypothetical protein JTE90_023225 [Oedothorax gibbosus]|uniref:Uncharacterized protein n=1 Tax=Oedothorax gibbosus TaxID=931172 RepID=A0AAV6VKM9_9ARAC|nr:hypothetical protein JTE90_023225 [Oedothorax gibbosus]
MLPSIFERPNGSRMCQWRTGKTSCRFSASARLEGRNSHTDNHRKFVVRLSDYAVLSLGTQELSHAQRSTTDPSYASIEITISGSGTPAQLTLNDR